jgi:hypothetical protein
VRFINGAAVRRIRDLTPAEVEEQTARRLELQELLRNPPKGPVAKPSKAPPVVAKADMVFIVDDRPYDLLLEGGDRLDVENEYQRLTDGPAVTGVWMDSIFVEDVDGTLLEVMNHVGPHRDPNRSFFDAANYFPSGTLGEGHMLVVRTSALHALEAKMAEGPDAAPDIDSKPVESRERSTLLTIIAALAAKAGVDLKRPSKAAVEIESYIAALGATVAARTIENHLKRIPENLERRS